MDKNQYEVRYIPKESEESQLSAINLKGGVFTQKATCSQEDASALLVSGVIGGLKATQSQLFHADHHKFISLLFEQVGGFNIGKADQNLSVTDSRSSSLPK